MKGNKISNFFVILVLLILLVQMPLPFSAEDIGTIHSSFKNGTIMITGQNANSLDLLTRDTVSKSFKENGILSKNSTDLEAISGKQLVVIGGPVVNSKTKELNSLFGVKYEETQDKVFITAKDITLSKQKISSGEDIGIIYFGKENNIDVLMLWGASREGTFAAGLILEDKTNLGKYGNSQFLLLKWKDANGDQFVQKEEVSITSEAPAITASSSNQSDGNIITVTITADFGNGYIKEWKNVKIPKGSTIFDAMKASGMQFDYNIQSLGVFVTSIEGLSENRSTGRYWQYWINGEYSQLGISNIKATNGIKIEWKYTDSFFN